MLATAPSPLFPLWKTRRDAKRLHLLGKRVREPPTRATATLPIPVEAQDEIKLSIPDFTGSYSTLGCSAAQPLLFLTVEILGCNIRALLDSGSSRTFFGKELIRLVSENQVQIHTIDPCRVITAAGHQEEVREEIQIPIRLETKQFEIRARLLPSLALPCILGLDFLTTFEININFSDVTWNFPNSPSIKYEFTTVSDSTFCCGIRELTTEQTEQLQQFLKSELTDTSGTPGITTLIEHRIDVGDSPPIKQRCYLVSPKIREAIYTEVDAMLEAGIVEPSHSEWSTPIVMVRKPTGKYRFCLDFRRVNGVSKKDAYPLPNMTGILDKLRSAHYLSTIDLSQAYFQIPLERKSREITAFTVPGKGLFHFTRMPYGLTGAPATFQRLLDRLIGPEMEPHAFAYLDDIIIVTKTFEKHLIWLKRVLRKIKDAGLTINPEKCEFCRSEVKYLGFLVQKDGLKVDPDKVAPILEYPAPKTIKQLRRFLGMTSWYRRFIPNFAAISEPLTRLLRKNYRWEWTEDQIRAFDTIRSCLTTAPILACPDFSLPFVVQTDASSVGLGAVLTQSNDGSEHVIAFASRSLSETEKKYSVTEQECLAVIWAIRKFRPYLEGYRFTVVTDHSSLRWLHNLNNPTGRLARWSLELLEYDYEIIHRKGALHHVPDALSRMFDTSYEIIATVVDTDDSWYTRRMRDVSENPKKYADWRVENEQLYYRKPDKVISSIVPDLYEWKLVVPRGERLPKIREAHDVPQAGHLGVEKTFRRIAINYFWPNMFRDITKYVRQCLVCQRTKVEQKAPAGLMGHRVIEEPWLVVAADIMGPFPPSKTGFCYLLVMQDLFTKWIECCPLRKATGKKISEAFHDLILSRWGTPKFLLTDNGTEFVNKTIQGLADEYGIRHTTVPPYHPQANPVERVNRVLKTMIVAFLEKDHREWDLHISDFRFAYNTAYHSSLQSTPAFINLGRELTPLRPSRIPSEEILKIEARPPKQWTERMAKMQELGNFVMENLETAYDTQARNYNAKHRALTFKIGDLVLKRHHVLSSGDRHVAAKLFPKYHGPFRIIKTLSPVVYELAEDSGRNIGKAHIKDLKPFYEPPPS